MKRVAALTLGLLVLSGCPKSQTPPPREAPVLGPIIARGVASVYADSLAGRPTASGAPYDPTQATCAHKRYRFGTVLQVERVSNGKVATCVVNDRGPFHEGRILDLSAAVAEALDIDGIAQVRLRQLDPSAPGR